MRPLLFVIMNLVGVVYFLFCLSAFFIDNGNSDAMNNTIGIIFLLGSITCFIFLYSTMKHAFNKKSNKTGDLDSIDLEEIKMEEYTLPRVNTFTIVTGIINALIGLFMLLISIAVFYLSLPTSQEYMEMNNILKIMSIGLFVLSIISIIYPIIIIRSGTKKVK